MVNPKERIAIIGSGISGLACAYFLSDKYDIKLYEKHDYLGGHSNTVDINYDDRKIAVDTGFIVFNHQTYPNLVEFFKLLNVKTEISDMSFGVKVIGNGLEYSGKDLSSLFSQKKNAFNPKFIRMLYDIMLFNKKAQNILEWKFDASYTLGKLLDDLRVGSYFRDYYLLPMSAAIWSCPIEAMLRYPAQSFVRFFKNHGLLSVSNQPDWYTVSGGSRQYVKKIAAKIKGKYSLEEFIYQIYRDDQKKWIVKSDKSKDSFDKIIMANHANQALDILLDPGQAVKNVLSKFKFQKNLAILHRDVSVMPNCPKAWSSWVYSSDDKSKELSVTYWMNNLQNINGNYPVFVTLNPNEEIAKDKIFNSFIYEHPIFDEQAVLAQDKIESIQGIDGLYFCGAYQKYGFHEDGLNSALNVINRLGLKADWQ